MSHRFRHRRRVRIADFRSIVPRSDASGMVREKLRLVGRTCRERGVSTQSRTARGAGFYPATAVCGLIDSIRLFPHVLMRPKWRSPDRDEQSWVSIHSRLSRLGDHLTAVADRADGVWLILESDWYGGFLDGPRWRLISVKHGGRVRSVVGFTKLPRAWRLLLTPSDF